MQPVFPRSIVVWARFATTLCALGLVIALHPSRALAGSCTWAGTTNSDWNNPDNWSCPNSVPTQDDDVIIPSGALNSPVLNGSMTIKSLQLQGGRLTINGPKLTVLGQTTTSGDTQLATDGEISSSTFDVQGGTTQAGGFGKITGPVHVELLATLQPLFHSILTISDNIIINGTLYCPDPGESIDFTGNRFSNNGKVDGPYINFRGSSPQAIDGSGQWVGAGYLTFINGITTTLNNSMQMSIGQLHTVSASALDIGNNTLTLKGTQLLVDWGTSVAGHGTLRMDNASFGVDGVVSPTMLVTRTVTGGGLGSFTGTISVTRGATLTVPTHEGVNAAGDLLIDGTLYIPDPGESIDFTGNRFSNNGKVDGPYINFRGSSPQAIDGSGQWVGAGYLTFINGITTTLNNSMQMNIGQLHTVSGSALDIGNNTLAVQGTQLLVDWGTSVAGHGTLPMDNASFSVDGIVSPTILVTHTVTGGGLGSFTGTISVTRGATLTVAANEDLAVAGDLLIDGVLTGNGLDRLVIFSGPTLVNNGLVNLDSLNFTGASQTIRGSGTYSSTTATVYGGTQLQLGSDQQLYNLHIGPTARVDLKTHTLILDQNDTPLMNNGGTITATDSTVVYNGTLTQTIEYSVHYHNLTISNTAIALAPGIELYVAGNFSNHSVFKHSNGTLILDGVAPQSINGVNTDFYRMTVTNTQGVTLTTNASVSSTLVLDGDIHVRDGKVLTFSGSSYGNYDVWGTVKRSGFVMNTGYMFGSPYVVITPTAGTSLPKEISLTLQNQPPGALLFAVPRTYIITPTNGSAFTATVQLHYRDRELDNIGEGTLQMWRLNGAQWTRRDKQLWKTDEDWLQRRDVSDFGTWALAAGFVRFQPLVVRW